MKTWVDGQPAQFVPLADRGLAYGDGLFETMRVRQGRIALLARHLQRLQQSCQRLGLQPDWQQLQNQLDNFCQNLSDHVCKLIVTRGDGLRGYAAPVGQPTRIILQASAPPQWPEQHARDGVHLFACQTRLAIQPALAGLKHLNRLEQVLARAEWQDDVHAEGLMLDSQDQVVEGVFSNLFCVRDKLLLTPLLDRCGVAGIMRGLLLDLSAEQGMQVAQQRISLPELQQADEVFMCNSLYGIWPVISLAKHHWPVGPVTRSLQHHLNEYLSHA